jgi:hypothetical protein
MPVARKLQYRHHYTDNELMQTEQHNPYLTAIKRDYHLRLFRAFNPLHTEKSAIYFPVNTEKDSGIEQQRPFCITKL